MNLPIDLPEYMIAYLDKITLDGRKASYIRQSRSDLRAFQKWIDFGTEEQTNSLECLHQLQKENYEQFVSWLRKNYSDGSVNRICTIVARLLQFLQIQNDFNIKDLSNTQKSFPLQKRDFISDHEYESLLCSFKWSQNVPNKHRIAHKELSDRNITILYLMRFYGLTPAQISRINMNDINFTHNNLKVLHHGEVTNIKLSLNHKRQIYSYLKTIPDACRPHFNTDAPLFVAFNNTYMSFQFNDELRQPKRLASRSIMKLIQVENIRAGIRNISSTHFRNKAILESIKSGMNDKEIMIKFGITFHPYLNRFKKYLYGQEEQK